MHSQAFLVAIFAPSIFDSIPVIWFPMYESFTKTERSKTKMRYNGCGSRQLQSVYPVYETGWNTNLPPAIYFGPFTVLPRTADSQLDYPLYQEFSDDSFSFSVISFTNISLRHQAGCLETIKCPDYLVRDFFHLLSLSFNLSVLLNDLALYLY